MTSFLKKTGISSEITDKKESLATARLYLFLRLDFVEKHIVLKDFFAIFLWGYVHIVFELLAEKINIGKSERFGYFGY